MLDRGRHAPAGGGLRRGAGALRPDRAERWEDRSLGKRAEKAARPTIPRFFSPQRADEGPGRGSTVHARDAPGRPARRPRSPRTARRRRSPPAAGEGDVVALEVLAGVRAGPKPIRANGPVELATRRRAARRRAASGAGAVPPPMRGRWRSPTISAWSVGSTRRRPRPQAPAGRPAAGDGAPTGTPPAEPGLQRRRARGGVGADPDVGGVHDEPPLVDDEVERRAGRPAQQRAGGLGGVEWESRARARSLPVPIGTRPSASPPASRARAACDREVQAAVAARDDGRTARRPVEDPSMSSGRRTRATSRRPAEHGERRVDRVAPCSPPRRW